VGVGVIVAADDDLCNAIRPSEMDLVNDICRHYLIPYLNSPVELSQLTGAIQMPMALQSLGFGVTSRRQMLPGNIAFLSDLQLRGKVFIYKE
jgi:hypothetical protein